MFATNNTHKIANRVPNGSIVTVGNFDGVHLGHKSILKRLVSEGRRMQLPSVAITFTPHPRHFFESHAEVKQGQDVNLVHDISFDNVVDLTPNYEKIKIIAGTGVENLLLLPFDQKLAEQEATNFITEVLLKALRTKIVVVGYDCLFGKDRKGDANLLRSVSQNLGAELFSVDEVPALCIDNEPVSSSRIRKLLAEGKVDKIPALLGRAYSVEGRVVHGMQRGRELGFPTANIDAHGYVTPARGVYACLVEHDKKHFAAVCNVGINPTFGDTGPTVEANIFNFSQDIYDQNLRLFFVKRLRPEQRFSNVEDLKQQMRLDAEEAKDILKVYNFNSRANYT